MVVNRSWGDVLEEGSRDALILGSLRLVAGKHFCQLPRSNADYSTPDHITLWRLLDVVLKIRVTVPYEDL